MSIYIDVGERECHTDNDNLIVRKMFEIINSNQCLEEMDEIVGIVKSKVEDLFSDIECKNGRKKLGPVEYYNTGLCKWGARTILLSEYDMPEEIPEVANVTTEGKLHISRYLIKVTPFLRGLIKAHLGYRVIIRRKFNICNHITKLETLRDTDEEILDALEKKEVMTRYGLTGSNIISNATSDLADFLTSVTRARWAYSDNYYNYYDSSYKWFSNGHPNSKVQIIPYFTKKIAKGFERTVESFGPVTTDYYGKALHVQMTDRIASEIEKMADSLDCHKKITFKKSMSDYNAWTEDKLENILAALKDVRDTFQKAFKDDPVAINILRKMDVIPQE